MFQDGDLRIIFIHNSSRMIEGDGNKTPPPPALSAINAVPRKCHSFWEASMKVYHIHAVHISAKQGSYLKIIIDICIIVSLSLQ